MAANSGTESVGLKGARTIGDKKVSSLSHFSWSTSHDSTVTDKSAHKRTDTHEELPLQIIKSAKIYDRKERDHDQGSENS